MTNIEPDTFAVEGQTVNKENKMIRSAKRRRIRQPRPDIEISVEKEQGRRLQTVRVQRNMSVPQLSDALKARHPGISGLGQSSLYGAENGERVHTPLRLGLISQYFNVPVSYFIFGGNLQHEVAAIHRMFSQYTLVHSFMDIPAGATVYTTMTSWQCDSAFKSGYYRLNDGQHYLHISAINVPPLYRVTIDDHVETLDHVKLQNLLCSFKRVERITHYIKAV